MKLLVSQQMVRNVAKRWKYQYFDIKGNEWSPLGGGEDSAEIYKALKNLPDDATPEDINKIIGNESWTKFFCSECHEYYDRAVCFGDNYEGVSVCKHCLRTATVLLASTDSSSDG